MSSPQILFSLSEKPTTITDLPPELITSIYKHLDGPSSIAALSSTCCKHYLIWQFNAVSISNAVTYNKLAGFSTGLELLYIQEKVREIDFTTDPRPTDRLLQIQQEARDAMLRDEKGGYLGTSLSDGDYPTTLVRNQALISNAIKAYHVSKLNIWGICPRGVVMPQIAACLSFADFVSAFYRVWILKTLSLDEAMDKRLDSTEDNDLIDMLKVVEYLVHLCPDNDKIYLEVCHGSKPCEWDPDWLKACLKISVVNGGMRGARTATRIWRMGGECHRDCSTSGPTVINEEDLALRLKDGDPRKQLALRCKELNTE